MKNIEFIRKYWSEFAIVGILALASVLFLFNLAREGYSNSYYAAAVKSMLTNPGILIYNPYDPVGFVTIDKPPFALWVQTLSAAVLGFSGTALILPQALGGLVSVFLLYRLVSFSWGKPAGLCAAAVLAITPIFVAVIRTNNMDGLLVFVLLISLYLAILAWRHGSLWYLLGSAVCIGIGFNIKMVQAFVLIPACFAIYLLNHNISLKKKILHLSAAMAVLLVISCSWAAMMDLTPAGQRPYIGSSQENSVFNLILGYNGLNRIVGGFGHPGMDDRTGGPVNDSARGPFPAGSGMPVQPGLNPYSDVKNSSPSGLYEFPFRDNRTPGDPPADSGNWQHQGGMAGFNDGGEPGLFRMGDAGMSGQISWLLPFALLGLLAWLGRPTWKILDNLNEREILAIGFSLWLVPELVYFSFTSGFYHTYYLVMVAVPLAGLVGISAAMMYEKYREPGIRGFLLPVVILVTGIVQWQFCGYTVEFSGMLSWIILGGSIAAALILLLLGMSDYPATLPAIRAVVVVGTGLLLVAPFIWACTPVMYEGNAALPFAGPGLASENKYSPGPDHGMQGTNTPALYSYLSSHRSGEKYLVGVESAMSGSDLIINYSAPVMAIGGFSGSDSILTVTSLRSLISAGEIRYFWLEQKGFVMPQRGGSNVTSWIRDSCPVVTDGEWIQAEQPPGPRSTLYDCKGVV